MDRDNRINFLVLYEIYSAEFGFLSLSTTSNAESLRIAYTSIAVVYGPLWTTQEAEIFKKHGMIPPGIGPERFVEARFVVSWFAAVSSIIPIKSVRPHAHLSRIE